MFAVLMIEEALPGEHLKASECVNEVVGPFSSEDECMKWRTNNERISEIHI